MIPNILSIAGSDPSGGAGVQADLKAIAANGGYGMAALTALTAQNTARVFTAHLVPPDFVAAQILRVFEDIRVDAVKIGMLASAEIAGAVADALIEARSGAPETPVVLDPVMVATSGDRLLDAAAEATIRDRLLPMATAITPNLPEAAALLGAEEASSRAEMRAVAARLRALGAQSVLLKGGHLSGGDSPDLFDDGGDAPDWIEGVRHPGRAIHGGGCTLSSAFATQIALARLRGELDLRAAARAAKAYVARAIETADALTVGAGGRPLNHFFAG